MLAVIDENRQLIASDQGLFLRERSSGRLSAYAAIEDKPQNRSNDGRVHPSGALWIGTMSKTADTGAGAIYHVAGTQVTKLFEAVSIPNGICFSPDGAVGYFNDSKVNHMMRVDLNPATGMPTGAPSVFIDQSAVTGVIDGSVVDLDRHHLELQLGWWRCRPLRADGRQIARYEIPTRRPTCPAFFGAGFDRLAVTSCWEV